MNPGLSRGFSWLIALATPFVLMMTAVRILFTPLYPQVVYRAPGFPADNYGFTLSERLHWAKVSFDYIWSRQDIASLANQQIAPGTPLYNERELSHMIDVQRLAQQTSTAWIAALVVIALLGIWAWRGKWMADFLRGLGNGGRITVVFVLFVLVGVVLSFSSLFTVFHELFFTGDSWLFLYSDTLIRLFPLPFWEIAFILVGVKMIAGAALLIWLDRKQSRRLVQ